MIVAGARRGDPVRAPRTLRALARLGLDAADCAAGAPGEMDLSETLRAAGGPVWILAPGAWPVVRDRLPEWPPSSAAGRPLCALGAVRTPADAAPTNVPPHGTVTAWGRLLHASGGLLDGAVNNDTDLPEFPSIYLEPPLATALAERLRGEDAVGPDGPDLSTALLAVLRESGARVVRWPELDVFEDHRLRVAEVITSLQRGGAERMVLDLAAGLPACGVAARVIVTGRPTREAFISPPGTVDVSGAPGGRAGRMRAAAEAAAALHADLLHIHLLHAADLAPFRATGIPAMITVHNMPQGWPMGLAGLSCDDVALLAACARRVEEELNVAGAAPPKRTIWNGIEFGAYRSTPRTQTEGAKLRAAWGVGARDAVLLALANPRPQKRLERLPAILARVRERLGRQGREAWLVIAGEAGAAHAEGLASLERLEAEIERQGVGGRVLCIGAARDVAALLGASDVLVSASAWEGLSLAMLEALAGGLAVVATAAGGTAEVAHGNPAVTLLPLDFTDAQAADAIAQALEAPPAGGAEAAQAHFHREAMTRHYARMMPRAVAAHRRRAGAGDGIWLVTNNFSTGGAQSSARRLLAELKARGQRVRAAVIQEQPAWPTPGRRALESGGIPVLALPPLGTCDPAHAVGVLLDAIDADPPRAVLMWNLVAQAKVLLADLLLDIPLYDVSPGEMNFASLEAYFASPRRGLPYRSAGEYGARLAGAIVKFEAERALAEARLGTRVAVIPNGVTVAPEPPGRRPGNGRLVIGTAARLSPQKKLEELLDALRLAHGELPPYVLRVAGGADGPAGGDYPRELRARAEGLNVEWLGETDDVGGFLRGLDLFAMISEPGGCPNASLEAMAAGLAVIATDFGGAREQVVDGETGRLTPRGDTVALARALAQAAADPDERLRWGRHGWERARRLFSLERMAADYEAVCLGGLFRD